MNLSDKSLLVGAGAVSILLLAAALLWRLDSRKAAVPAPSPNAETPASSETPALARSPTFSSEANQREVTLFFESKEGEDLVPEKRKIFLTETVTDQARQTVRELIEGSHSGLVPTIPRASELREVYLSKDGTAYIDFSQSFVDGHSGGSSAEIDTVFSLVDTLTFNFPEIKRVKILVEGEERNTLKDHLDLSRAYVADMSIVRRAEER